MKDIVKVSLLLSISLVFFILFFQPYDYNQLSFRLSFEIISLVFLCTFFFSVAYLLTLRTRFGKKVWQMIALYFFYIFFLSQILYFYTIFKDLNGFSLKGVGVYYITSLFLSIIPFLVLLIFRKRFINQLKNESGQLKLKDRILKNDRILLFKAEDNYVRIKYLDGNDELKSKMERTTMKEILKAAGNESFLRVHRSYAINLDHFSHCSGNRKGYFVYLNRLEQKIPVSRNNKNNFLKKISSIHH